MLAIFFSSPKFFNQFDAVISLGSTCFPAKYLKQHVKSTGSIFDYIGSSLSGVIDIITKNWEDLFNAEEYKLLDIYQPERYGKPTHPFITHIKYKFVFPHDASSISDITPNFFSKLKGRIQRFEEYCRSAKKLLFIRLQQDLTGRIVKDDINEIELLPKFIQLIRTKYGREQVNMIFINTQKDGWNEDKTILFVKIKSLNFKWQFAASKIHNLFLNKNVYSEFE